MSQGDDGGALSLRAAELIRVGSANNLPQSWMTSVYPFIHSFTQNDSKVEDGFGLCFNNFLLIFANLSTYSYCKDFVP